MDCGACSVNVPPVDSGALVDCNQMASLNGYIPELGITLTSMGVALYNNKDMCAISLTGGDVELCGAITLYLNPDFKSYADMFFCKSEVASSYCNSICESMTDGLLAWQMGIFNPSGGTAPGSKGFGSLRPKDWACSAASDDLSVQWVNGAGEKITVTETTGGCTYEGVTAGPTFNVSANAVFVCVYADDSNCAHASQGDKFESTVTLTWKPASGGIPHMESGQVWKAADA